MSFILEAANEIHLPAPHRGLSARLQSVHDQKIGVAHTINGTSATGASDRWLWAAVGAAGVGLSLLTMAFNKLEKVIGSRRRTR
jgi:hypothetical protein